MNKCQSNQYLQLAQ